MTRIRSAKPEFWTDPLMCGLKRDVRFTFKGLWEVCADDEGRFQADPRLVKAQVWPLDDDLTVKKVAAYLAELAELGRILLYDVGGARYGVVLKWHHQKISHPTPSKIPPPPPEFLPIIPESLAKVPEKSPSDKDKDVDKDIDVDVDEEEEDDGTSSSSSSAILAFLSSVPPNRRDSWRAEITMWREGAHLQGGVASLEQIGLALSDYLKLPDKDRSFSAAHVRGFVQRAMAVRHPAANGNGPYPQRGSATDILARIQGSIPRTIGDTNGDSIGGVA